jgi:hypothetical protein
MQIKSLIKNKNKNKKPKKGLVIVFSERREEIN